ncbi:hypothetical protein V8F06_005554 [Rhypophila decipiens]
MARPPSPMISPLDQRDWLEYESGWNTMSESTTSKSQLSRLSSDFTYTSKTALGLLAASKELFSSARRGLQAFCRNNWTYLVALLYTVLVFSALLILNVWYEWGSGYGMDCERSDLESTTESRFHINLHVAKNLSFTQAKLIDLGWDIGVSHGGRLLHGWVFYHVAASTITWLLEHSALPYSVLLSFLFQPDSLGSLWSLVSSVRVIQGARAILKTLLLVMAVAHILFFTTIWSAATGYQNPQALSFPMPDQSWATKDSPDLRLCWLPDAQRPELFGVMDSVILGPSFGDVFTSLVDIDYNHIYQINGQTTPEEYQDLFAYAHSKFDVEDFLERFRFAMPGSFQQDPDNTTTAIWWNEAPHPEKDKLGPETSYTLNQSSQAASYKAQHAGLPTVIKGWQRLGFQQGQMDRQIQLLDVTVYTYDSIWDAEEGLRAQYAPVKVARSDFHLDQSVQYEPGVIPYNSSIWYNGATINLTAPFLGFKSCLWWGTPLGECLCYKGRPLTEDFRLEGNKACTGQSEYIWGFSYFITTVGLGLELFWCLTCLYLWIYSEKGSELAKYGRPNLGAVRNILDISEILNEELGENRGWHTEKQLLAAVKRCPEVGYGMRERSPGVFNVRLVSFPGGRPLQKQP